MWYLKMFVLGLALIGVQSKAIQQQRPYLYMVNQPQILDYNRVIYPPTQYRRIPRAALSDVNLLEEDDANSFFLKTPTFSLSDRKIPDFGDQIKDNLYKDVEDPNGNFNPLQNNHKFDVNGFFKGNDANIGNNYGGGLDYNYKDRLGASLDVIHNELNQQTDINAMGHLNVYKNPERTTSFDLNAGFSKSYTPYNPISSWNPNIGFVFSKSW